MSIATKTGDDGTTALMYGRRVPKIDPRVEAYGNVDELNAALGLVRASVQDRLIADPILSIQKELVLLMGELAVAPQDHARYVNSFDCVTAPMVDRLTGLVEDLEKNHKVSFKGWATPGATLGAASLDLARTVCRRAERSIVRLSSETGDAINPEITRYLNRLSDLCWLYARYLETKIEST